MTIVDSETTETFNDPLTPGRQSGVELQAQLFLALECERPSAGSARYGLAGSDEVLLGRGAERRASRSIVEKARRLQVQVPDRRMSAVHARLSFDGDGWTFEDLQSRNGSLVNGVACRRARLGPNDLLQVGHTLLFVESDVPTPAGTATDQDARELRGLDLGMRTLLPALGKDFSALAKVARSEVSLLLISETGTGKEVLARAAHRLSGRAGELVAVNCGAIPATLVESTLFGHVKGAFSGAVRDELGLVRAADHGTLFLDEIGELPRPAQAALLRVLQEREVTSVGGTRPQSVDIRVIAATHRPLEQLVARGEFRADLLARLEGFTVCLPPLRERRADLGLLIADLLPRFTGVSSFEPAAAAALLSYGWPQNVRELERALALTSVLSGDGVLTLDHLPDAIQRVTQAAPRLPTAPETSAENDALRAALISALAAHAGNVSEVARSMGKARQQIHRWLQRFRLDPKVYRS